MLKKLTTNVKQSSDNSRDASCLLCPIKQVFGDSYEIRIALDQIIFLEQFTNSFFIQQINDSSVE